ncbi:MAG: carboxypeptidase regulatory-like domain-containing protein [Bacteroidia bacterium]|jgi:hypothetical protein
MRKHVLICVLSICVVFSVVGQLNYQWVKAVSSGLPGNNVVTGITKDGQGNIYVTGTLTRNGFGLEADFNPFGTTPKTVPNPQSNNCFFAKYSADGDCEWAEAFDLYSLDALIPTAGGAGIAVDNSNNIYILGVFKDSVDVDVTNSEHKLVSKGISDCFLVKYDQNRNLIWAKQIGGVSMDVATGIAIDNSSNELYIAGYYAFDSLKVFDGNGVAAALGNAGGNDIFMAKFQTDGTFLWAKNIGADGDDIATAIDFDFASGYLALTGSFQDTVDFNHGQITSVIDTAVGGTDAFIAKFMSDGTCGWEKNIGHTGSGNKSTGTAVKIDGTNNKIYLAGTFSGVTEFNLSNPGSDIVTAVGERDFFIAKYNINDASLNWRNYFGSSGGVDTATVTSIAIDNAGSSVYLAGNFEGTINFDPGGTLPLSSEGVTDAFISKYDENGAYITAMAFGASKSDGIGGFVLSGAEDVYVAGSFVDTVDFNPGDGIARRGSANGQLGNALFVAKYAMGTSKITGTVTGNGSPIQGRIKLYTQSINDGNIAMNLVSVDTIINGQYAFDNLSVGFYILLADATLPDYIPTYYGNSTVWESADTVYTEANTIDTADITMATLPVFNFNGPAHLKGMVKEGNGFERGPGDPIPGVGVGLEHDPQGIVAHTETDADGNYEFTNVPAGEYTIYVNIAGLPMDSTYNIYVQQTDTLIDELDFIADSSAIDTVSRSLSSISEPLYNHMEILTSPNPYREKVTIQFMVLETSRIQLELYNMLGEKVADIANEQRGGGIAKYSFNAADKGIRSGMYLLHLKVGDMRSTKRLIQIE